VHEILVDYNNYIVSSKMSWSRKGDAWAGKTCTKTRENARRSNLSTNS
jgi:hypothetical protein